MTKNNIWGGFHMQGKKAIVIFVAALMLFSYVQSASAGIKVINGDCPVFISSHMMGSQVIPYPNGMNSMMGVLVGFSADKFPINVNFQTLTNFFSVARYQPVTSALVLTDSSGKNNLARYEFQMNFDRPGAVYNEMIDWKISLPSEGFYAFNVFVDGNLVGYYPFYVWSTK